ncbi:MAG: hypothetical protein NT086_16325 [Proteobacteria bacterium]|nr:hypothetical protein [Pseudomonadota bacterium]
MSNLIDHACDVSEMLRVSAIERHFEAAKQNTNQTPQPNGECRWCEAIAVNDAVFCCEECAKDWQGHNAMKQKAKLIAGR